MRKVALGAVFVAMLLVGEATSAEFQGAAEDDLANVLAGFSKYF